MTEANFKLPNPPIVEAVLDIECDMRPGQQFASLEDPARERFRDRYPKVQKQYLQEHRFETKADAPPKTSFRQDVQAFRFLQDDEKQLVQVRAQGFSFNRLAPYTSLDDYLPEIERTWRLFIALASPVQIRQVRLRYINRLLLPMAEGRIDLDDYLKVGPRLPDEKRLTLVGFLNQYAAVEVETRNLINVVLTTQPSENGKLPVIFDNCVTATGTSEPDNWPWILGKIKVLRALKNDVFRDTLTEPCLNLFRQP